MEDSFLVENGKITFETNKIRITDKSKKQKLQLIANSVTFLIFGLLTIIRYFTKGDEDALWIGSIITIIHLVVLILYLFRSYQAEISFDEIKSIKVKERFGQKFLDIKLKNQKLKRVIGIYNKEKLQDYLNAHVALKAN